MTNNMWKVRTSCMKTQRNLYILASKESWDQPLSELWDISAHLCEPIKDTHLCEKTTMVGQ